MALGDDVVNAILNPQTADIERLRRRLNKIDGDSLVLGDMITDKGGLNVPSITAQTGIPFRSSQEKRISAADAISSITFDFPAIGNHILWVASVGSQRAAENVDYARFRINGDTGNNYYNQSVWGTGATATAGSLNATDTGPVIQLPAANSGAGQTAAFFLFIPHYNSSLAKSLLVWSLSPYDYNATGGNTAGASVFSGSQWSGTAPIRSLSFYSDNTANFATDSLFSVYLIG